MALSANSNSSRATMTGNVSPSTPFGSSNPTLLERLVWVRYRNHWWPALLYDGYEDLQASLYDQLDVVLKAQFAMAILRQSTSSERLMVARLLGRNGLEVVELVVGPSTDALPYAEFYWQLPHVIPKSCSKARWIKNSNNSKKKKYSKNNKNNHDDDGDNIIDEDLYLAFHRALDQVENIIRCECENNFALLPGSQKAAATWLDRAHVALQDDSIYASSVVPTCNDESKQTPKHKKKTANESMKGGKAGHSFGATNAGHISGGGIIDYNDQEDETARQVLSAARFIKQQQDHIVSRDRRRSTKRASVSESEARSVLKRLTSLRDKLKSGAMDKRNKFQLAIDDEERDPSASYSSKRRHNDYTSFNIDDEVLPGIDSYDLDQAFGEGVGEAVKQAKAWATSQATNNVNRMHSHQEEKELPSSHSSSQKVTSWENSRVNSRRPPMHPIHRSSRNQQSSMKNFPLNQHSADDMSSTGGSGSSSKSAGSFFASLFGGGGNDRNNKSNKFNEYPQSAEPSHIHSLSQSVESDDLAPAGRIFGLGTSGTRSKTDVERRNSDFDPTPSSIRPPKGTALSSPDIDDDDMTTLALWYEAYQEKMAAAKKEGEEKQLRHRQQHHQQQHKKKQTVATDRSTPSRQNGGEASFSGGGSGGDAGNGHHFNNSTDRERALLYEAYKKRMSQHEKAGGSQRAGAISGAATALAKRSDSRAKKTSSMTSTTSSKSGGGILPCGNVNDVVDTSDVDSYQALLFDMRNQRIKELRQQRDAAEAKLRDHQHQNEQTIREQALSSAASATSLQKTSSSWSLW